MTDNGIESPQIAPTVETTAPIAAPEVSVADVAAPVESPPAPVDAPATETPESPAIENILGDGPDSVTEEPVKAPEAKPDADKPAEAQVEVEIPTYEEFTLPENYTADKESMSEFTKLLGELEIASGKLDHTGYQLTGQKLIDLGTKAIENSINRLNEHYSQIHNEQVQKRLAALKADPVMGGEKFTETVSVLRNAVEQYAGTPEQAAEFRKEITESGLYSSPSLSRLLFNMQQKINKYETESDNGNGGSNRIVPGAKPAPGKTKDYQRFYGGNS